MYTRARADTGGMGCVYLFSALVMICIKGQGAYTGGAVYSFSALVMIFTQGQGRVQGRGVVCIF